jgi:hypothetical protein
MSFSKPLRLSLQKAQSTKHDEPTQLFITPSTMTHFESNSKQTKAHAALFIFAQLDPTPYNN